MNILVIGSGGREHAIVRKLKENPKATEIFCAPGNGGISADAVCVPIKATDVDGMVSFAKENQIDFVVVAPDDPLVLGMVDAMNAAGIDIHRIFIDTAHFRAQRGQDFQGCGDIGNVGYIFNTANAVG